jgi:5-(carboxyamino)imidazole ribonucleotide synthase
MSKQSFNPAAGSNGAVRRIGILGGGQLARMMGLAGIPLGIEFLILDPGADACASIAGELLQAGFGDEDAARELQALEELCPLYPASNALGACQDRLVEKTLLSDLGIAVAAFHAVSGRPDLLGGLDRLVYPAVLKTRRMGYDGKGQAVLRDQEDLERAWQKLGEAELILEAFVPFEAECSLVGVRGQDGDTRFWPLTQNVHDDGILALSRPGVMGAELQAAAETKMLRLMEHFDYRGVLTIEFFLRDGELLANEIAPRVHNSGHWTVDGSECSQFENHVRAVSGMPLGRTSMVRPSLMFNWIGEMPDRDSAMAVPGLHWHDYGKEPRPGRKIGHATLTAGTQDVLMERAARIAEIAGGNFPVLIESLD